jgi:2',3'-cyclic-nucleotide 2'-phosphodiesterase
MHAEALGVVTILFIGDIVGKAGRRAVETLLTDIRRAYQVDVVIANGENAAGGVGITPDIADKLFAAGIDVLTSGNHIWQKKEIFDYLRQTPRLIRPLNYAPEAPGQGSCFITTNRGVQVAVVNLAGRVFMEAFNCPFRTLDQHLEKLRDQTPLIVVDFHAEATSEKIALGWHVDGKVSAVIGTHTHVQTADERILPYGTAFITDAGMTGARDSVIGVQKELAIQKFLTWMPVRFETAMADPWLAGVLVKVDPQSGRALDIQRIQQASAETREVYNVNK